MEVVPASATYTVLARRYRPQGFEEVIGQEHVATSLRNAILSGRVGHAYLFTGARGVGKTSTARILAKALNCPNAIDGTPCNHCDTCESIAVGRDVDVLEIDGASNTGVDNIRDLRANANVMSMRSKYKVYIIDEVHMLSKSAFAALLKTLEEPPPNVKFIFCTTDPQKVPDTILSRCQRFDFGTIGLTQIIDRLASIALAENMEVEPAALELVARRAAGSMRDSQSIFDQLLASADKRITAAEVHRLLGTASDERLMELFAAIIARQRAQTLSLFSQALAEGAQLGEFTDQILVYLRDLMVLAAEATNVPLLSVSETNRTPLAKQAQNWGLNTVVAALQIISEAKFKVQRVTFGRAIIELALIRLTLLEQLQSLDALLTELASPQLVRAIAPPTKVSNPTDETEKKKPEPVDQEGTVGTVDRSELEVVRNEEPTELRPEEDTISLCHDDEVTGKSAHPTFGGIAESLEPDCSEVLETVAIDRSPELETPSATVVPPESSFDFRPGVEIAFWAQVIADLGDDIGKYFRKVVRTAISGPNRLELVFPKSYLFAKQFCEKVEVRGRLEEVVFRLAGRPVQVVFSVTDDTPPDEPTTRTAAPARRLDLTTNGDPYVDKAIELFNAKVMKKEAVNRSSSGTD